MRTPLVSVIMPAYNAATYIKEAIDSILNQHYKDFELIIIDDASTDNTAEIVLAYNDARILYLKNESNLGIVSSRNRGLTMAKGEYTAILDSDDISLPDRLTKQVAFLEDNPHLGACGSYYYVIDAKGKKMASVTVPGNPRDAKTFLYFNVCFCHSTLMMRTSIARMHEYKQGFDIIEDYELAYSISRQWEVSNIRNFTTRYRVHGKNISIDKKNRMLVARKTMDSRVLNDLGISYSENELELHSNFINMNVSFFTEKLKLEKLEKWLLDFYQHIKTRNEINASMVKRIFAVRWFQICFRTGHYGMMFNNRLLVNFKGAYMKYNLLYMKNMLTGHLEVV